MFVGPQAVRKKTGHSRVHAETGAKKRGVTTGLSRVPTVDLARIQKVATPGRIESSGIRRVHAVSERRTLAQRVPMRAAQEVPSRERIKSGVPSLDLVTPARIVSQSSIAEAGVRKDQSVNKDELRTERKLHAAMIVART